MLVVKNCLKIYEKNFIRRRKKKSNVREIKRFDGVVVAMGRKVERVLKNNDIEHSFIYHPATRGEVRNIDKYCNHFKNNLNHLL